MNSSQPPDPRHAWNGRDRAQPRLGVCRRREASEGIGFESPCALRAAAEGSRPSLHPKCPVGHATPGCPARDAGSPGGEPWRGLSGFTPCCFAWLENVRKGHKVTGASATPIFLSPRDWAQRGDCHGNHRRPERGSWGWPHPFPAEIGDPGVGGAAPSRPPGGHGRKPRTPAPEAVSDWPLGAADTQIGGPGCIFINIMSVLINIIYLK
nr:translation initiation factor IF-2-like [Pan troglodytes]